MYVVCRVCGDQLNLETSSSGVLEWMHGKNQGARHDPVPVPITGRPYIPPQPRSKPLRSPAMPATGTNTRAKAKPKKKKMATQTQSRKNATR